MKLYTLSLLSLLWVPHQAFGVHPGGHDLDITPFPTFNLVTVIERQEKNGKSCPKCARPRCRQADMYRDQADCQCKKCPPGMKPLIPKREACVPGDGDDKKPPNDEKAPNNDERKKKKEEKFAEAKKRKQEEFDKKKKRELKAKKFDEVKARKVDEFDKRKKAENDKDKKLRKKQRMGKCLTIVPLCFAADAMTGFAYTTDFFSEEFVSDEDDFLMGLWPIELDDVPDVDIDRDEYLNAFVEAVNPDSWITNHIGPGKRQANIKLEDAAEEPPTSSVPVDPSARRDVALNHHRYNKRFIQAIVGAVTAFVSRVGPIVARVARVGVGAARFARLVRQGGVRLAKGAGKGSR